MAHFSAGATPGSDRAADRSLRSALRAFAPRTTGEPHRGVNSQPAPQGQFSTGLDTSPPGSITGIVWWRGGSQIRTIAPGEPPPSRPNRFVPIGAQCPSAEASVPACFRASGIGLSCAPHTHFGSAPTWLRRLVLGRGDPPLLTWCIRAHQRSRSLRNRSSCV